MIARKPVVGQRWKSRVGTLPQKAKPEPKPAPPPTRREMLRKRAERLRGPLKSLSLVGAGIVIAVAALFTFTTLNPGPRPLTANDVNDAIAKAMASATPPPPVAALVYQQIQPSVVTISTRFLDKDGNMSRGRGTGVVLDQNGAILTSLHVVKDALDTQVTFADGSQSSAAVLASEPEKDIAVLKAAQPPQGLVPATLGNPRGLHPGDTAVAVGNPFGLTDTVTAGTVSGLERTFVPPDNGQPMTGLIQFDAAVNPGNSGGPLLNSNGEVVGIVTGLVNPTGQDVFIGIGFAVPIDVAAAAAGSPPY